MEGMWVKMWDPPTASPATPDEVPPTNPVPEVMAAAGYVSTVVSGVTLPIPSRPHTVQRDLLHGMSMPTWDNLKQLVFYTFTDPDIPATSMGTWPGATIRVPRGTIYHCETSGKGPPPHTIHWHGIEPTPMNDGVGHCSMEIGHYIYQWQANFIGTYFYHCHRNTLQHFEFGLYGLLLIEPPDAYFSSIASTNPNGTVVLNTVPIGHCRDGKRRTAANLSPTAANPAGFPQFPDFNNSLLTDPDPLGQYSTDPHAMTVAYDVEALWVLDDRDSVWSDLAPNAFTTFPKHGNHPGIDDRFDQNPGSQGFFAFNDFNADYWFVTGVPVPAHRGGTGIIDPSGPAPAGGGLPGGVIPPALNSGISGTQIAINAVVDQTILVRCLDAAYNSTEITFPVDVVIIAWDGRALGQPPFGHNEPYLVPAGTPIRTSTARRFDALIRSSTPVNSYATVKFIDTRGENVPGYEQVLCTAWIPITIGFTDSTVPTGTIVINGGAAVTRTTSATLTLSAYDAVGVTSMQFSKSGTAWFPWEPFATTRNVTLTSSPAEGDGVKTMYVRYKDTAGNISAPVSASIILNRAAPTGTISINSGAAYTRSASVSLALTATAAAGTVTQMQLSKDGVNYFAWETFAATRTVTLTAGEGLKSIYVRYKDSVGNVSAPIPASITLDTTAPTGTIAFTTPNPTTSATGTLALTATDGAGSGVSQMQFSKNGSPFFPLEPFATSRTVSLSTGLNTLTVRFRDAAGNLSPSYSATITRN
jgi:FtsP/CotA-like multicopper oxidase with cupredoxin domain